MLTGGSGYFHVIWLALAIGVTLGSARLIRDQGYADGLGLYYRRPVQPDHAAVVSASVRRMDLCSVQRCQLGR